MDEKWYKNPKNIFIAIGILAVVVVFYFLIYPISLYILIAAFLIFIAIKRLTKKNEQIKHDREIKPDNFQNTKINFENTVHNTKMGFENTAYQKHKGVKYHNYSIKAKYTQTNRIRTVNLKLLNLESCKEKLLKDGYVEPFEITEIPPRQPTEAQLDYAKSLNLDIPSDADIDDVSSMISRRVENDNQNPNPELIDYAIANGIMVSEYIGKRALYNQIYSSLDELDKVAFFVFCMYRDISDDRRGNMDTHPSKTIFYEIGNELSMDKGFLESLRSNYHGESIRFFGTLNIKGNDGIVTVYGGSKQTKAYQMCSKLIREKFQIPSSTKEKTIYSNSTKH